GFGSSAVSGLRSSSFVSWISSFGIAVFLRNFLFVLDFRDNDLSLLDNPRRQQQDVHRTTKLTFNVLRFWQRKNVREGLPKFLLPPRVLRLHDLHKSLPPLGRNELTEDAKFLLGFNELCFVHPVAPMPSS